MAWEYLRQRSGGGRVADRREAASITVSTLMARSDLPSLERARAERHEIMNIHRDELAAARATTDRLTERVRELEADREPTLLAELDRMKEMFGRLENAVTNHLMGCPLVGSAARAIRSDQSERG